jgi:iron complex outermembrane recepter protein
VIGEPISIVSSSWGGVANRNLIYKNTSLVVPASVVDAGVASGFITAAPRSAMFNLADLAQRAQAYSAFTAAELADIAQSTSGYQYTPAYFNAGGQVFTRNIEGSTVLSDDKDYADSENLLYFLEIENSANKDRILKGQFLLDYINTDKLSTYGYAISTEQLLFEAKGTVNQNFSFLGYRNFKRPFSLTRRVPLG